MRILEIGAGTGGTTERVLPALQAFQDRVHYLYTDISPALLARGQALFGDRPFMEFAVFDVGQSGFAPPLARGMFHLVLAANVLHATPDVRRSLGQAKALLRTGGWLVLNEATATQAFTTLTFGLLPGWWQASGPDRRLEGSPLLSSPMWHHLLREEGFDRACVWGDSDDHAAPLGQHVIIAESNGCVHAACRGKPEPEPETLRAPQVPLPSPSVQPRTKMPASRASSRRDDVIAGIMGVLSLLLQVDSAEIDATAPFHELGIDSILAVQGIHKLNESMGLALRTTDFFNFATAEKLADHIIASSGGGEALTAREFSGRAPDASGDPDEEMMSILQDLADGRMEVEEAEGGLRILGDESA